MRSRRLLGIGSTMLVLVALLLSAVHADAVCVAPCGHALSAVVPADDGITPPGMLIACLSCAVSPQVKLPHPDAVAVHARQTFSLSACADAYCRPALPCCSHPACLGFATHSRPPNRHLRCA
ncbi:MAG TPA: hypothetical protein VGL77_02910 [Armatimonadota bacterium]